MSNSLQDPTRNQHFLSQVEQRLNAIDPTLDKDNQRIYQFEVLSRSPIELGEAKSNAIEKNLSMLDLFSFDVDRSQKLRHNFEALFNRYEAKVETLTETLLAKLAGGDRSVESEVVDLHSAKLLNFVRNPFSVPKILDTFGALGDFMPLRADVFRLFRVVLQGRRQHQKYLCEALGITDAQYERWLRMLFNLLMELEPGSPPMLDQIVKTMFDAKDFVIGVFVSTYSSPGCLLSDRGFSTNIEGDSTQSGFDFNLNSRAFIRYIAMSRKRPQTPANIPQSVIDAYMSSDQPVRIYYERNDVELLRSFNMNVIVQSHRHVYGAIKGNLTH